MRRIRVMSWAVGVGLTGSLVGGQERVTSQPGAESWRVAGTGFSGAGGRLSLSSMVDGQGREWAGAFPEKGSIWKMALRGPGGESVELASGELVLARAEAAEARGEFGWKAELGGKLCGVQLIVSKDPVTGCGWRLNVELPEQWTVTRVDCPIIPNIRGEPGSKMATPFGWGLEYDVKAGMEYQAVYPSLVLSSPFVAFYRQGAGIYLGAFDRAGRIKRFAVKTDAQATGFTCTHWPVEWDTHDGAFSLTIEGVMSRFTGDYWEAGQIYRALSATAPWGQSPPAEGRQVPLWLKQIDLWLMPGPEPLKNVEACRKAKEYFGGESIGLHWYNWHEIPFDTLYPEYFPAKASFKEGVKALQDAGMRVMPYINGRLCDPKSKTWTEEHADRSAARKEDGSFYAEVYGSKVPLNVMCPATKQWQAKITGIVDRLVNECGVDGVYIDQIGAAAAVRCYADDHGHSPGGGDFWVSGYRKMLADIRAKLPQDRILTTEENAECWNDQLDALLMVNTLATSDRRILPMMPTVYADRIVTFGFQYIGGEDIPKALPFRAKMARAFIFGSQLGWVSVDAIMADSARTEAEFLRNLVRCRGCVREYFVRGRFMGEIEVGGDNPRVKIEAGQPFGGGSYAFELPAVMASAWAIPGPDGKTGIALVNLSDAPHEVVVSTPKRLLAGRDMVSHLAGPVYGAGQVAGSVRMEQWDGKLTVPAREARFVDMRVVVE